MDWKQVKITHPVFVHLSPMKQENISLTTPWSIIWYMAWCENQQVKAKELHEDGNNTSLQLSSGDLLVEPISLPLLRPQTTIWRNFHSILPLIRTLQDDDKMNMNTSVDVNFSATVQISVPVYVNWESLLKSPFNTPMHNPTTSSFSVLTCDWDILGKHPDEALTACTTGTAILTQSNSHPPPTSLGRPTSCSGVWVESKYSLLKSAELSV